MTSAQKTHRLMVRSRQADEDRRLIASCDRILESATYAPEILDGIRADRDLRQARLDRFVAEHGWQAIGAGR